MNWRLFIGIVSVAFGIAGLVIFIHGAHVLSLIAAAGAVTFGALVLADETDDEVPA